ncbi:Ig-like domain-containing protein [Vibrio splendidus]|uniref:Ig-like domain-containing protein n=1 Tax=Vibrio splendidus TaxID=29497 RepID=UPI0021596751|nr:Ig-like domain-containing protein [Vibrio splendidus]
MGTDGDTVRLTLTGPANYSNIFTAVVNNGVWSLTIAPALPSDGDFSWSMTASDAAGNMSAEVSGEFTLDTIPPVLTNASLDASSDSGFEQDDGITQVNTPTFNIVGEVGTKAVLKLWDEGAASGTPKWTSSEMTIGASGILSITHTDALDDGNYVWLVVLTDVAGNISSSDLQTLTIDTVAPSINSFELMSDSGKDDTDNITNENSPSFGGLAEEGSRIQLEVKNGSGHALSISPPYITVGAGGTWTYQLTNELIDGTYTIKAIVTDVAGNTTESSELNVVIDTTPPLLTDVGLSESTDSGSSNSDGITKISTPTYVGKTEVNSTVTVVIRQGHDVLQTLSMVVTNADGSWELTGTDALEEGAYNWVVTATDIAGNISDESVGEFVIDTSIDSFTASLASDDDTGSNDDDAITNKTDVALEGSGETGAKVTLKSLTFGASSIDVSSVAVASVSNNAWSISLPSLLLGDGVYNYTVEIEDVAGNTLTTSGSLTIDTQKPTLHAALDNSADSGSSENDEVTNVTTPTFSGQVSEASTVTLKLFKEGNLFASYGPVTTSKDWSIVATTPLDDGEYTWTVEATDIAGNIETYSSTLTIDTTPPTLSAELDSILDTGESSSDGVTNEQNLKFKGIVGGEGSSSIELRFEFGLVGSSITSSQQVVTSGDEYEFSSIAATDGAYLWKVIAVDIAGNEVEKSGTVIVDTNIQDFSSTTGLDSSSDLGQSDQDGISSDNTPSFVGKTEANAKVSLVMAIAGVTAVTVEVQADDQGNFFITVPSTSALEDGTYAWTLQATDLAGNTKSTTGTYVLDTVAPGISFSLDNDSGSDNEDWVTNHNLLSVSGITDDSAKIKVTLISGTTVLDTKEISPSSNSWTYSYATNLDDGRYTLRVESTDIAGNTFSESQELVIDTVVHNEFTLVSDSGSLDNDQITNAEKLVFSGTTDNDATVRLTVKAIGGDTLHNYTPTVNVDTGQWSFEFPDVLSEGQYIIVVTATDVAGNTNISSDYDITIDRTPPLLSGIELDSSDDTGAIGDWVTETKQVSISGQTSIGSTVKIYIEGIDNPITAGVSASGVFTAELPELDYGIHSLTIIAMDIAGNAAEKTQNLTISPNALPFTANLEMNSDSGELGDNITNITSPVISGMGTPGYTVKALIGGVTYTVVINEAGEWSFQIPVTLSEGTHRIEFVLVDDKGAELTQDDYEFVVDTNVESTVELDLDSDSGEKGDFITNANNINLVGSTEVGVRVVIEDKTTGSVLAVFTTTKSSWRYVFSDLPEGTHDFVMRLEDIAGNTDSQEFSITVDRTAPVLNVQVGDSSDIGSIVSRDKTQEFKGTVSEGTKSLTLLVNGVSHDVTINNDGTWLLQLELSEGINNFNVIAEDVAGNSTSIQGLVHIKTSIRFNMELENDNGQFDTDSILSGTEIVVGGTGGVGDIVDLVLTNDQGRELDRISITIPSSGIWQHQFTGLQDGNYTVSADVRDDAGNTLNRVLDDIIVDNVNEGFTAQIIDDNGIVDDSIVSTVKPIFRGAGEVGSLVTIVINDLTYNTQVNSAGTWQFQVPAELADGSYQAIITSIDRAGNKSSDQIVDFTIDGTDPTFGYEIEGAVTNNGNEYLNADADKLVFKGTASEAGRVTIHINNMEFTQQLNASGNWEIEIGTIVERAHPYTISYEDIAGNIVTETGTITVDRTIQTFVDLDYGSDSQSPGPIQWGDNLTNHKDPTFTFNRSTRVTDKDITASVVVRGPNDYLLEVNDISVSSNWRVPESLPTDGTYVFEWSFVDEAGNTANSKVSVRVDSHIDEMAATDFLVDGTPLEVDQSFAVNKKLVSLNFTPTTSSEYYYLRASLNGQTFSAYKSGESFIIYGLPLNVGNNDLTITVWDKAGNSTSINQSIFVKTDFDQLEISIDGDQQTDLDNIEDVYSNAQNREIALNGATDVGTSFTILIDNKKVYDGSVDENGLWDYQLELSEGNNKVTINFVDIAGNIESVTFNAVSDTVAPIMTVDSIDGEGHIVIDGDNILRGDSVTLQGRIDSGSIITSVLLNGVSILLEDDILSNGRWDIEVLGLVEGKNTIIFTTEDTAGNSGTETISVVRDSLVSDFSISLNDGVFVSDIMGLNGTIELGSSMSVELLDSAKDSVYTGTVIMGDDGSWSVLAPTQPLADDEYTWKVVANDRAGNTLTKEVSFTLDTTAPDAPTIALANDTGSVVDDKYTNDGEFTVTPSESGNRIEYLVGGSWVTDKPVAVEGTNTITVREIDLAGNASDSAILEFTLDTKITGFDASLTNSADGLVDSQPEFSGSAEPDSSISIKLTNTGTSDTYSLSADSDSSGSWSVDSNGLPNGEYTWEASITDKAGNLLENKVFSGESKPNTEVTLNVGGKEYQTFSDDDGDWAIKTEFSNGGVYQYQLGYTNDLGQQVTDDGNVEVSSINIIESSSHETENNNMESTSSTAVAQQPQLDYVAINEFELFDNHHGF